MARRGKFIMCALHSGEDLVFHLGMTGHLRVCDAGHRRRRAHLHLRAPLDDGRELRYDDARRFGRILLGPRAVLEDSRVLPVLGVEPLSDDFTADRLDEVLRSTTRTLKAALLDQRGVAGLGNIYVDEACHLAGVRPQRRCHTLTRAQRAALHAAIPAVLRVGDPQPRQQHRRLPRPLERQGDQPGAPPGVRARRPGRASAAARSCARPPSRVAPLCGARRCQR